LPRTSRLDHGKQRLERNQIGAHGPGRRRTDASGPDLWDHCDDLHGGRLCVLLRYFRHDGNGWRLQMRSALPHSSPNQWCETFLVASEAIVSWRTWSIVRSAAAACACPMTCSAKT